MKPTRPWSIFPGSFYWCEYDGQPAANSDAADEGPLAKRNRCRNEDRGFACRRTTGGNVSLTLNITRSTCGLGARHHSLTNS